MTNIYNQMLLEGVSVEIVFGTKRPFFGDLFLICGEKHPRFPPSSEFGFDKCADLHFGQVDDYFGVRSASDEGDDVIIWLYPVIDGDVVDHNLGPFDSIRIDYNVLRNPTGKAPHYLKCLERLSPLGTKVIYRSRGVDLGIPPDFSGVKSDIAAITSAWAEKGIDVGSSEALRIDS